jgi:hypothetical protein
MTTTGRASSSALTMLERYLSGQRDAAWPPALSTGGCERGPREPHLTWCGCRESPVLILANLGGT